MARVRSIPSAELSPDLTGIYERFAGIYGPFRNQVAVFAHVPAALRHLMSLLIELREAATLPRRTLELAIVTVSSSMPATIACRITNLSWSSKGSHLPVST